MNLSDLTLAEIEQIEEAARMSIAMVDDPGAKKARLMTAIGYVIRRRDDPNFTWEQAGAMTIDDVTKLMTGGDGEEGDADDPPTAPLRRTG